MPLCVKCNRVVCRPCIPGTTGAGDKPKIIVARDLELLRPSYFRRLAVATANLELPRRRIPDWMADVIYGYEGRILWPDGTAVVIPDNLIDDAFNNDGSFRWLSDFIRFAERMPRQAPQQRVVTRLRLLDLAFRIDLPDTARHFGR